MSPAAFFDAILERAALNGAAPFAAKKGRRGKRNHDRSHRPEARRRPTIVRNPDTMRLDQTTSEKFVISKKLARSATAVTACRPSAESSASNHRDNNAPTLPPPPVEGCPNQIGPKPSASRAVDGINSTQP